LNAGLKWDIVQNKVCCIGICCVEMSRSFTEKY